MIIEQLIHRAISGANKKIIFTEASDPRIQEAAAHCAAENIADIIMIGDIPAPEGSYEVINPKTSPLTPELAMNLFSLRQDRGLTLEQARDLIENNPMYFACMMVHAGHADGIVSGACHSTADTLRPALQILKKPAFSSSASNLVSSFFLMEVPNCEYGANGVFLFADAGLNQNPTPMELAEIAASSAGSFRQLVGAEPVVALLSHSTKGSATHADVDKILEATSMAKQKYPDLNLDGELQADVALDGRVASLKNVSSSVAGHANTLVFPDLDAGNISYKLVQYLAKAKAYGPITQGLAKPVNDLSRGCNVDDIVGVTAITAVQAAMTD